ncbi:hypothetical protein DPMN_132690 [Dreissena polymorpha]|uniref:Uncharacterized protein n=1 Tax=Dreissena polymorpha TaxID=45954 RepID=A0A9D4FX68_DREPO|nr:hypothetical protein DPMN_132690 [Dreissena polymorpha]
MSSKNWSALNEESMDKGLSGSRGASMVQVVGLLQKLGIASEDVDALASGPPGGNAYDVVFEEKDKYDSFFKYLNKGLAGTRILITNSLCSGAKL